MDQNKIQVNSYDVAVIVRNRAIIKFDFRNWAVCEVDEEGYANRHHLRYYSNLSNALTRLVDDLISNPEAPIRTLKELKDEVDKIYELINQQFGLERARPKTPN